MGYYDAAQVCLNGHLIHGKVRNQPCENKNHCPKCGERTITECPRCRNPVQGDYINPEGMGMCGFGPPRYCHNCGSAFPWTERKIQAAIELYADQVEDEAARRQFEESVQQIARDTPQGQVAANRLKKVLARITGGAGEVLRKLVVDVAASGVKSLLQP